MSIKVDASLQTSQTDYMIDQFKTLDFNWNWSALSFNKSLPFSLVEACIDKPWDWTALSCHPSLSWSFVLKHKHKPWNWHVLSSHKIVTCEIVIDNLDLDWSWTELSFNRNMTWNFVNLFWFKPWDWVVLSSHLKVGLETIASTTFIPWSWDSLSYNEHFIIDVIDIRKELNRLTQKSTTGSYRSHQDSLRITHLYGLWNLVNHELTSFHWSIISSNPCLRIDMLKDSKGIPWDFHSFLYNSTLAWDHVKFCCNVIGKMKKSPYTLHDAPRSGQGSDESFWHKMNDNSSEFESEDVEIGGEDFLANLASFSESISPSLLVPISIALSSNRNVPLDIILSVLERHENTNRDRRDACRPRPYTWEISKREDLNIESLKRLLQLNGSPHFHDRHDSLCWPVISRNPNFTWEIIKENSSFPWCWFNVSSNPNITLDIVDSNRSYPWSWEGLSCNPNISLSVLRRELTHTNRTFLFSRTALSAHINFNRLQKEDIDMILNMCVRRMSRDMCYMLAKRQTSSIDPHYKRMKEVFETFCDG